MNEYTIIGLFDNGLRYLGHRYCRTVEDALQSVARVHPHESISIVAVIAGHHEDLLTGDYLEDTDDINREILTKVR